jgi:hypothetical protein
MLRPSVHADNSVDLTAHGDDLTSLGERDRRISHEKTLGQNHPVVGDPIVEVPAAQAVGGSLRLAYGVLGADPDESCEMRRIRDGLQRQVDASPRDQADTAKPCPRY